MKDAILGRSTMFLMFFYKSQAYCVLILGVSAIVDNKPMDLYIMLYIQRWILKFWFWGNISVTSDATRLKIVPNKITFFVYTPFWQVLCNFKERLKIYPEIATPQCTDLSSRLCILETSQFRQETSQRFVFMATQCSSISQYVLYISRTFCMIWVS